MAGSERSGVEHADGGLFLGAAWILCAPPAGGAAKTVARFVRRLGARPIAPDPIRHDQIIARLSHLPQILSVALVNAVARGIDRRAYALAGPAYCKMSRLATSSETLWRGILRTNRDEVRTALDEFSRELGQLRSGFPRRMAGAFRRAARLQTRLIGLTRSRSTRRAGHGVR